jgi:hypothetical protein
LRAQHCVHGLETISSSSPSFAFPMRTPQGGIEKNLCGEGLD